MRGITHKTRALCAFGLLVLVAGLVGADLLVASETQPPSTDAVAAAQSATQTGQEGAEARQEGIQASTPAEEMGTRVRSIRRNEYFYQSYGRKDLFAALVTGDFEPTQGGEIVDVNSASLVGVIWGAADRFALVEDGSGNGYILRVGDRVSNGRVTAIQKDSLVAAISLYGITSRVILRLENREGDQ